ncbi:MAG: dTMP kinase [Gammaproteobacteria bacterium]|jgi:dTMP kinase
MSSYPGKFITIEGIEGVGKTTNREYIRDQLQQNGKPCIETREPGGTPLGEALREMLLEHKHEGMSSDAELLMMFAARAEHLHKVILPALEAGNNVLCDRFTEATYAYQGGGRGINAKKISDLENWVQGELRPDLTIILDAPVAIGRERAGKRSAPDRIEKEQNDFFERVRHTYLELAEHYPHRIAVVDASVSIAKVQDQIYHVMKERGIID